MSFDATRRTWKLRCREDDMRQREAENLRHEIDETRREIDVNFWLL